MTSPTPRFPLQILARFLAHRMPLVLSMMPISKNVGERSFHCSVTPLLQLLVRRRMQLSATVLRFPYKFVLQQKVEFRMNPLHTQKLGEATRL
mmetsp:Transcript_84319/g.133179  ORF Transcript_84319/g.133179 Transcript_84319/m.133179 type:complete len:93 (-) Transcript_84319:81-359(-)